MFVEVKDSKFVRDVNSMALINKDNSARDDYLSKVRMLNHQKDEINKIKEEVSSIKDDVLEIKNILRQLLGKGSNG
jgi:hypothetical protein